MELVPKHILNKFKFTYDEDGYVNEYEQIPDSSSSNSDSDTNNEF